MLTLVDFSFSPDGDKVGSLLRDGNQWTELDKDGLPIGVYRVQTILDNMVYLTDDFNNINMRIDLHSRMVQELTADWHDRYYLTSIR